MDDDIGEITSQLVEALPSQDGRFAIMARIDETTPWVQVDSVLSADLARKLVADLEDDEERLAFIENNADAEWAEESRPVAP